MGGNSSNAGEKNTVRHPAVRQQLSHHGIRRSSISRGSRSIAVRYHGAQGLQVNIIMFNARATCSSSSWCSTLLAGLYHGAHRYLQFNIIVLNATCSSSSSCSTLLAVLYHGAHGCLQSFIMVLKATCSSISLCSTLRSALYHGAR